MRKGVKKINKWVKLIYIYKQQKHVIQNKHKQAIQHININRTI